MRIMRKRNSVILPRKEGWRKGETERERDKGEEKEKGTD